MGYQYGTHIGPVYSSGLPVLDPYIPNIGLSGQPLTDLRESRLHSRPGSNSNSNSNSNLYCLIKITFITNIRKSSQQP